MLLSLLMASALANTEMVGNYGVGLFHSAQYGRAEVKHFSLGIITPINDSETFAKKHEAGLWVDQVKEGRKSSAFGSYSLGVRSFPSVFELSSFWGIGVITNKDVYLGGCLPQFFQDFYMGMRDDKKTSIGLNYRHISSAGLYGANKGRDFLTIRVQWRW